MVEYDGKEYYEFLLDANEEGGPNSFANKIELTDVQIYVSPDPVFATPESTQPADHQVFADQPRQCGRRSPRSCPNIGRDSP